MYKSLTFCKFTKLYNHHIPILEHFDHLPSAWKKSPMPIYGHSLSVPPPHLQLWAPINLCVYGSLAAFQPPIWFLPSSSFTVREVEDGSQPVLPLIKALSLRCHPNSAWCSSPGCCGFCFASLASVISQACHASRASVPLHMPVSSPEMPFCAPGWAARAPYLLQGLPSPATSRCRWPSFCGSLSLSLVS